MRIVFWYTGGRMSRCFSDGFSLPRLSGRYGGWWLLVVWIASMAVVDSSSYTLFPINAMLIVSALLTAPALLSVAWGWCSVIAAAAAAYFLWRCGHSYALVESWHEGGLLLACVVFYLFGSYSGQRGRLAWMLAALGIGLILHAVYFFLMRWGMAPLEWTGRSSASICGSVRRPVTLFVYKNFAGLFFMTGGSILLWACAWATSLGGLWRRLFGVVGGGALALSFWCNTRVVIPTAAVCLFGGWVLWLLLSVGRKQKLGALALAPGVVVAVAGLVVVADLMLGGRTLPAIAGIDSHSRFEIWKAVIQAGQHVGAWGMGARSVEWEVLPFFQDWNLPNFAHNEYLQAWLDYGWMGGIALVLVLAAHVSSGFWGIVAEGIGEEQRVSKALAVLLLISVGVAAFADFPWHDVPLAAMSAFACGVLASPYPRARRRLPLGRNGRVRVEMMPLRTPSFGERLGVLLVLASVCWGEAYYMEKLWPAWRFQRVFARQSASWNPQQKCSFLAKVTQQYPDSHVADQYTAISFAFPRPLEEACAVYRSVLQANPKQLYMVAALASVYDKMGEFEEAEALYRKHYPGEGPLPSCHSCWPGYYGSHLLQWGRELMVRGRKEQAYSMMEYALNIDTYAMLNSSACSRADIDRGELRKRQNQYRRVIDALALETTTMRAVGLEKDDQWKLPMTAGGKGALYPAWGNNPAHSPVQGRL